MGAWWVRCVESSNTRVSSVKARTALGRAVTGRAVGQGWVSGQGSACASSAMHNQTRKGQAWWGPLGWRSAAVRGTCVRCVLQYRAGPADTAAVPVLSPRQGTTVGQDLNLSTERLTASRNFTNKLWNAGKFVLFNLQGKVGHWSGVVKGRVRGCCSTCPPQSCGQRWESWGAKGKRGWRGAFGSTTVAWLSNRRRGGGAFTPRVPTCDMH